MNDEGIGYLEANEFSNASEEKLQWRGTEATKIVIASTFTADPLSDPLVFWMNMLSIPAEIKLAPYAQVMRELLDPDSLLSQNKLGFNILVIRLEDWIRDRLAEPVHQNIEHIRATTDEFVAAFGALQARRSAPTIIYLSPPSSSLETSYARLIEETNSNLKSTLSTIERVSCYLHPDITRLYPVFMYEDERADRIGHVPYLIDYFVAIATFLARRIAAYAKPRFKVIVVDCDDTLWEGLCGEEGCSGVGLTDAYLDFQRMLLRKHDEGVLLCVCSKNNAADVEAVFANRADMVLREEHLITRRVNWDSKSSNLESLAQELELSLESFVFIDDSAVECAEVKVQCPSVLTLQFPKTPSEIQNFLDHVWAFDSTEVTKEASQRTAQYKQNRARSEALRQTGNLEAFLTSLEVKVNISPMRQEQLSRVTELTQRTNQFNLTTIRRGASEIDAISSSGEVEVLVVHVKDRFGDYGLVGAVFLCHRPLRIEVDTFVLSCRVLGRGVEHQIINELGRIARRKGQTEIVLRYRPTPRNAPALSFLESFAKAQGPTQHGARSYVLPAADAEGLAIHSDDSERFPRKLLASRKAAVRSTVVSSNAWHDHALRLQRLDRIVKEFNDSRLRDRGVGAAYVAPRTETEAVVSRIWADVLGVPQVGILDNFFDLGGDSLLAVQAIARTGAALSLELSICDFFDGPTIKQVASRLTSDYERSEEFNKGNQLQRIPLSGAQRRVWFIDQLEGGSFAYHVPLAVRFHGELNKGALEAAISAIIERHQSLRTRFVQVDGEPVQQIREEVRFALPTIDLTTKGENREAEVFKQSKEEQLAPFNLSTDLLIRGRLLRLSASEHVLLLTMHHMVSDGWSLGVLIREMAILYEGLVAGKESPLEPLPVQYADYALWQRSRLSGNGPKHQLNYWIEQLRGVAPLLALPLDRRRPPAQSYRGASAIVPIGHELTSELKNLSRRLGMTLAMILCAGWAIVLSRLSGQEDIVLGIPIANRPRPELERLIGFFVSTVAIRLRVTRGLTVHGLLRVVRQSMLDAYANQDVPFDQLVESLHPIRSLSHSPIYQVMFVMQNAPRGDVRLHGLAITELDVPLQTSQCDLTLSVQEDAEGIVGRLNYATDLFDHETVERWGGYLKSILSQLVRNQSARMDSLPLMCDEERRKVVELFNPVQVFPVETLIHELFEAQVTRTPSAAAVTYNGEVLTYSELNVRSNQLAWHLRNRGVVADQLVGLCVERGLEMIVAIVGILKAGGAYVPLDPNYPTERLAYMLEDASPRILLTQRRLITKVPRTTAEVITIDDDSSGIFEGPICNPDVRQLGSNSRNLAYVIYTSGSTGKPKGVMIEHRNVTRLFAATESWFEFGVNDVWTMFHSFAFDFSVWEIWGALLYGGRLVIVPYVTALSPRDFYGLLCREGVTLLNQTPSAFVQLIEAQQSSGEKNHSLRAVVFGGEALEPLSLQPWVQRNGAQRPRLVNMYGITETTVHVTYSPLSEIDVEKARGSVVGKPIRDLRVYILDGQREPVPIGVTGELYVAGAGVARGYLGRRDLTAERFLPDPFSRISSARMYKTGDLGRWLGDGTIDYFGRNDGQVKLRGFRIELGEIEAQLLRHAQVNEAVVVVHEGLPGDKSLVAYVVLRDAPDCPMPGIESLRSHLRCVLPDYMLPSAIVSLDRMPLTSNGKLNRSALPRPDGGAYASKQYEAPQGEVEEMLAGIWQNVLRQERVGRNDNFFELGGHSLLVVQLMERLRRVGLTGEVRRVFESPTLADLAGALTRQTTAHYEAPPNLIPLACEAITPEMLSLLKLDDVHIDKIARAVPGGIANIQDIYPLAPLQEGILFHHILNDPRGDPYVVPTLLMVATRERVDKFTAALQQVIDRHDILRTAVLWEQLPQPVQVVYRNATLPVEEVALGTHESAAEVCGAWMSPEEQRLNLGEAPLIRVKVAEDKIKRQWYVLFQLHHIIADNTSREILISEIVAQLEEAEPNLPEVQPYRNHVAQTLAHARTHDAEAFFRHELGDVCEPTIPFGLGDVHGPGDRVEEARGEVEPELARRLRQQARRLCVSSATLFHAAWGLVVARTSGLDDVVFGSVLLGRLQGDAGAQRILGMFINTLPLRLRLQDVTATELIERTQRALVGLVMHEQASLAVAQRASGIVGSRPLFSALLNYRHRVVSTAAGWSAATEMFVLATRERTNYPITMSVDDSIDGFELTAKTDPQICPSRIVGYLQTALRSLVDALDQSPQKRALLLPILPSNEFREVVYLNEAPRAPDPEAALVHELFEQRARRSPDAIAALSWEGTLTYAQLNGRANQLARHLIEKDVGPDQLVAICLDRGLDMIVGLLGILKAGGAYLPLDPCYPDERLIYMMGDARPKVLLTHQQHARRLSSIAERLIALDVEKYEIANHSSDDLDSRALGLSSDNLIYAIYTSGSTGKPKGVMVSHRSVVSLWQALEGIYHNSKVDGRVAINASFNFDSSVKQFVQLLSGRAIVTVPPEIRSDPKAMLRFLKDNSVESIDCTPLQLKSWIESGLLESNEDRCRMILVGGEAIDAELWNRLSRNGNPAFYNVYGPTECTVDSTCCHVNGDRTAVHIGRPIKNSYVYILDRNAQVVPVGVAGEIYVGGRGVARGYLNRPELTADKFIADSFSGDPNVRLYRTGDVGRWRQDGNIEYIGRNDHQVKIRGMRVELDEIQKELARHSLVRDAVVVARDDVPGDSRLVAYVVPIEENEVARASVEALRAHLRAALPEHMVPSAFVMLNSLPLTRSGKVDRQALPKPDLSAYGGHGFQAPQGSLERALAEIWQQLLGVSSVSRQASFFDLGGHSLLIMKLLPRIEESTGRALTVADVYRNPRLYELAARIRGKMREDYLVDLSKEANIADQIVATGSCRCIPAKAVLFTGGTGFVGRFLLEHLLRETDATIYCLVRAASENDGRARLRAVLSKWDLWREDFATRLVAVPADLRLPRFGMDHASYDLLCSVVDEIYHCATSMNHLETYEMAKPMNVQALGEIFRFATNRRLKLVSYLSTTSVFRSVGTSAMRIVDEGTPIDQERHRSSSGYVASKWVGEKICMIAGQKGVPCNIFRLGLVWADTKKGRYDELQRGYRFIKSSMLSGVGIANYRHELPPTPVDYVARAVVFLAQRHPEGNKIFHISSSDQMAEGIFERCNELAGTSLDLLPLYKWICNVRQLHHQGYSLPAVPLVEFAFSMSEDEFDEYQRSTATRLRVECGETHRELEAGGIMATALDDGLLLQCLESMLVRDDDLRKSALVAHPQRGRA
jgi:amino acid adenylation domain-containing protein/FkbH-like protein/thioester reductase-like protein